MSLTGALEGRSPPPPIGIRLERGTVFGAGKAKDGGAVYADPGAAPADEFRKNTSHD